MCPPPSPDYSLAPFFDSSPDLLCIAGFDGYFKKVNPAFRSLMGYTIEELVERPVNEFIHPEDRNLTQKHRSNLWSGKPLLNFENRYITKTGDIIWLSWTSMPKSDLGLVYAIAKNITHIKEQEKRRNNLIAELTETNERLKQLSYSTSHDIRSPISNLLSIFSLWDTSSITDPETLNFVEMLKSTSERLKATMDQKLDGLQGSDAMQVEVTEVSIAQVLESVLESLSYLIRDAKAQIKVDLKGFRYLIFNYAYLESVLMNLITNSIKYAHPDRPPVITIETSRNGHQKRLSFSDNGIGFDIKEQQGKVFGLHQTFHKHTDSKGIGLYLVHNHIVSLGGKISVESEVNVGTRFLIEF